MDMLTKEYLIAFEAKIADLFKRKKIRYPIHLSGGNETQLIEIFKNIEPTDYVFSTHRNHYHALLHGVPEEDIILNLTTANEMGSMHTIDHSRHFYSSAIVAGCVAIACGVALGIKTRGREGRVWCFVGDGASDEGWFREAYAYAYCKELPITYIIEDNNRSVCTTKGQRWGFDKEYNEIPPYLICYKYTPTYPHVGIGEYVTF